jgi:hypothetical protein
MATQAYWDWDRAGRPWRLAQPIKELYAQAGAAGVGRLGTLGSDDASHLKNDFPQDHTPFSETAWPDPLPGYVVCACDLEDGPWSDRLLARARAGGVPWLKYLNFRGMQFSRKTGWAQRTSSDRHLHVSGMSNHTWTSLGGENPFTGQHEGNVIVDEATEKDLVRRVINADENYLHPLIKMDPNVSYLDGGGNRRTMPNSLVATLVGLRADVEEIRRTVAAPTPVGVDAAAVADALASNPTFIARLAEAIGDDTAARMASKSV